MLSDIAPRVSVLMSVYNGEPYLEEAIRSILDQTFTDFEFLIIDDGSTDNSAEIASRLAREDERIRFKTRENRGLAQTLNELIEIARGEYLARMDADDVSLSGRFEKQVTFLDSKPDIAIVGGKAIYSDAAGRPIFIASPPLTHEEIDESNLIGSAALIHPSVMMRADFIRGIGGYDTSFVSAQDVDLWLRAAEYGRIENLADVVIRYRITENSVSGKNVAQQSAMATRACQAAWARRGLAPREMVEGYWRPSADRTSRRDFSLKWGWQAWNAGNQVTARHFFFKALCLGPFSRAAWNGLLFGALRKRS